MVIQPCITLRTRVILEYPNLLHFKQNIFCNYSTTSGNLNISEILITAGADLTKHSFILGLDPLQEACRHGHTDVASLFVSHGMDVNAVNYFGVPALYWAVMNEQTQTVTFLLENGAVFYSKTMLRRAAALGSLDMIKSLLSHGANPNERDFLGTTPLHKASARGRNDVIDILVSWGGDVNAQKYITKNTPLHDACKAGYIESAKLLVSKGSNPDAMTWMGIHAAEIGYVLCISYIYAPVVYSPLHLLLFVCTFTRTILCIPHPDNVKGIAV